MVRQRKAAAERRTEIVEAAIRLAADLGPDRVSAQMLADEMGLSQPAIFKHFASKSDIWRAVGEEITRPMQARMPAPVEGQGRVALDQAIEQNLCHIERNPAIPAILFSRELHAENEGLRRHFERVTAHRRSVFARLIAQAQVEKGVTATGRPDDLAALVLAIIQGLAMRWSLENRRFDLGHEGTRLIAQVLAPGSGEVRKNKLENSEHIR